MRRVLRTFILSTPWVSFLRNVQVKHDVISHPDGECRRICVSAVKLPDRIRKAIRVGFGYRRWSAS